MATADSILTGIFALAGVTLQQVISTTVSMLNRRRDEEKENRAERRALYGRVISQGRRVQRLLKDSTADTNEELEKKLDAELDRFAELNAELRLIAPAAVAKVVLELEDEMRDRADSMEKRKSGPLPLGPIVDVLRRDLHIAEE
ncbi:hypothetical protein ABGB14_49230 [Nonomuraea sp. B10E15]|uniref:hypothetical protein n=1 Tax=Nonomuraea sp. B10E15 TaxID=3153560 RepID=UPI00325EC5C3